MLGRLLAKVPCGAEGKAPATDVSLQCKQVWKYRSVETDRVSSLSPKGRDKDRRAGGVMSELVQSIGAHEGLIGQHDQGGLRGWVQRVKAGVERSGHSQMIGGIVYGLHAWDERHSWTDSVRMGAQDEDNFLDHRLIEVGQSLIENSSAAKREKLLGFAHARGVASG